MNKKCIVSITKAQELEILDKAIEHLGPASYLGPWLTEVRSEVESSIRSDFFPEITIADSVERGNQLIARAKSDAAAIVAAAEGRAKEIVLSAQRTRDNIASAIHAAQREINKW